MDAMALSPAAKIQASSLCEEFFKQMAEFAPDIEFGRARSRLDALFLASWKIQDFKACLAIQKEINKLLKLNA